MQGVGLGAMFVSMVWASGLLGLGLYRQILTISVAGLALNAALVAVLVSIDGAQGAAIGTSTAEIVLAIVQCLAGRAPAPALRPSLRIAPGVALAAALGLAPLALTGIPVIARLAISTTLFAGALLLTRRLPTRALGSAARSGPEVGPAGDSRRTSRMGAAGGAPVREFLASYRRHAAGVEHELIVLLNGVDDEDLRSQLLAELENRAPAADVAQAGSGSDRLCPGGAPAGARAPVFRELSQRHPRRRMAREVERRPRSTPGVGLVGANGVLRRSLSSWVRYTLLLPGPYERRAARQAGGEAAVPGGRKRSAKSPSRPGADADRLGEGPRRATAGDCREHPSS